MVSTIALAMLLLTAPQDDLACNTTARAIFAALLRESRFGFAPEEAAFIIRMPNGTLAFVRWPAGGDANRAAWSGAVPRGTIAIAHTHPRWLSMPSRIDERSASASRLPVYVVTTSRVTRTAGGRAEVVIEGEWSGGV